MKYYTKKFKGIRKPSTTIKYVHIADSIKRQVGKRNLFNYALRSHKNVSGQHKEKEEFAKIAQLSPKFSSVEQVWARQEVNKLTVEKSGKTQWIFSDFEVI